ncbi:MAG TPA: tetratricopeptide repeat protein [Pyrinomonadaceae bacterium]|jgi:tetratricopeptide (TPR) repeat protein|nr:tetratricopeptide repeat protein [Pyrinomonadaceae bacterium]
MNFRYAILSLFILCIFIPTAAPAQKNPDAILVFPFENCGKLGTFKINNSILSICESSGKSELNWIGESFADALTDLLKDSTLTTVSNEERKFIQVKNNIPLTTLPSIATSLRLAREARASLMVTGKYEVVPEQQPAPATDAAAPSAAAEKVAASIRITARIIRVNDGSFLTEEIDGKKVIREIVIQGALGNLQRLQGELAYQIFFKRDGLSLPFEQNKFIEKAITIPPLAFEAYIKALLTPESDTRREAYLKNALNRFTLERAGETYTDAALELGHYYLNRKEYLNAIDYFSRIPTADPHYAEAAFYTGLIHWGQGNYEPALATLRPLADDLKLIAVHNILGAISLQAARAEKKNTAKSAAFLSDGVAFLKQALDSSPNDQDVRFNYAYGLFLQENYNETAEVLRPLLAASQKDGPAYFLLAKAIEATKGKEDPNFQNFDNQARKYLPNYAKSETEWQKGKSTDSISLRIKQPPRKDFAVMILSRRQNQALPPPIDETQAMLLQARNFYKAGRDDDALAVINRILTSEPMSAEAYLIMGNIRLRRGELEAAVSALKTALFWDNKLLEGHIALGKIFYEKRDCQQAETYSRSASELAISLSVENDEVIGLQKMVEKCKR